MAEVPTINKDRIQSPNGLIKDIEDNILTICKNGFIEHEHLRAFEPNDYVSKDPKRAGVKELPSLFVYVENVFPNVRTIGQGTGASMSVEEAYIVCVQYVSRIIGEQESYDDSMKICQHYLYRHLLGNLNINDLVRGTSSIMDIDSTPEYLDYNRKYQALDNFIIRVKVGNLIQMPTSRR